VRIKRKAAALAASVLVGIGMIFFAAMPAQAAINSESQVRNWATGRCLDSNWNGNVYTLGCNWGNYQNWAVIGITGNIVSLGNAETGRCLDSNWQGQVYTLPCNAGLYQQWYRTGDSYVTRYINRATNLCLDSNAAGNVYTLQCNNGGYQNWREGF
jgi:hypothetical protein